MIIFKTSCMLMHAIPTNDAFALTTSGNIYSVKDELTRGRRNRKQQQSSPVLHLCLCQQLPDKKRHSKISHGSK